VYYSRNGGATWESLQFNLPIVPITDLTVKDDDLVAATQGRAFWVMDDLTPLRAEPAAATAHLFPPREAVRSRRAGFGRGAPGIGQNPPAGAIVTYQLSAPQEVTLEFIDSSGAVVKSVSSRDRNGPSGTAGLHRYAWDMRYADAHGIEGGTFLAGGNLRGPLALPGTYSVRLKAGGQTETQPLRIVPDPQSEATEADLQKQFDLLIAIRDKLTTVNDAANDIRKMRASLPEKSDRSAIDRLKADLETVQKQLVELRFSGFDDQMLVFDLKLNNRIAALQNYVSQGDYAPTDQQYAVFKELSTAADAALQRYGALKLQMPRR